MSSMTYPWYETACGDDIYQGDILEFCPVFSVPADLATKIASHETIVEETVVWEERDVVVMSQSCDMVKDREKLSEVLLCSVWKRSEIKEGHLASNSGMENARKGNLPAYHVLAQCLIPGLEREPRVVDFRRVYSLPLAFLRKQAAQTGNRVRLLPPYREHLSQAFARFFMRVGLPVDIPPFK